MSLNPSKEKDPVARVLRSVRRVGAAPTGLIPQTPPLEIAAMTVNTIVIPRNSLLNDGLNDFITRLRVIADSAIPGLVPSDRIYQLMF